MKKIVAVIDGGGRGSALVAAYAKSPLVGKILAIPGNDGMSMLSHKKIVTYPHLATTDVEKIVALCKKEKVSLIDVAQDNAVAAGLVDAFVKEKIPVIGPTKKAGELEWNKAWARNFMEKYKIPCPKFYVFTSQKDGLNFLKKRKDQKWFVKAAGLAEGKGALGAANTNEAMDCIKRLAAFGTSAETYLLEDCLDGEEFSAFFISDGKTVSFVGTAQDHKRIGNFDEGENTGGMGCVSSPLIVSKNILKQVKEIAKKTILGMEREGRTYAGILYIGCMVVRGRVFVIEYNCRWGDPEAEVLLPGITTNMYKLSLAVVEKQLKNFHLKMDKKIRVVVAGVAKGYPKDYSLVKGKEIFGLLQSIIMPHVSMYPAGLFVRGKRHFVKGGRIFYFVGEGKNILSAREAVYKALSAVFIEGNNLYYRIDIGWHDMQKTYLS